MTDLRFDPSKAVTFDLTHGLVHLEGAPARLLVPADALLALAQAAGPEATAAFGRSLGEAMGRRAAARLDGGLTAAPPDVVLDHLGGELALAGLGSLGLERWGRALVLVLDRTPLDEGGDALLESVLAAALEAAAGRRAHVVALGHEEGRTRFLVGNEAATARVRAWLSEGVSWGEALGRLHAPGRGAA